MHEDRESGYLVISISDKERLCRVARAFSSAQRLEIMELLTEHNAMKVSDVAKTLKMSTSTVAMHISVLEEAGLIASERQPSIRGTMKMCTRIKQEVVFQVKRQAGPDYRVYAQQLPIGAYSAARDIVAPCGIAAQSGPVGPYNNAKSFYMAERLEAGLLWLREGALEYQFAMLGAEDVTLRWLEVTFEVCSQVEVEQNCWQGHVQVSVNGKPLGTVLCGCEPKGRRGAYNPGWWPDIATQYGKLLTYRVDGTGTWAQNKKIGDTRIGDLGLLSRDAVNVTIEVPHVEGSVGINLFGHSFGDFNQGLQLQIGYSLE